MSENHNKRLIYNRYFSWKKSTLCLFLASLSFLIVISTLFRGNQSLAESDETEVKTLLDIQPKIAVEPAMNEISISDPGIGNYEAVTEILVEANTAQVNMYVEATDFIFQGNPDITEVEPIELDTSKGATIEPDGATPISGSNRANFIGDGDDIDGIPSQKTETLSFLSNEPYKFQHSVFVSLSWSTDDPLKPAGEYEAKMRLRCFAVLPSP